jgi:DNA repair exonuclease SbcCD ATPase subunit
MNIFENINKLDILLIIIIFLIISPPILCLNGDIDTSSVFINITDPILNKRLSNLENEINQLNKELAKNNNKIQQQEREIKKLEDQLILLNNSLQQQIIDNKNNTDNKFNKYEIQIALLNKQLNTKSKIIFYSLLFIIISLFLIILYFRNKSKFLNKNIDQQIQNIKYSFEKDIIKVDNRLIELLSKQLEQFNHNLDSNKEIDHSLALKIADEVSRIQMNLNNMDPDIKGYKQLLRAVNAILDNYNAYGYEIPDLLNKEYDAGMKVIATMIQDDSIPKGKQIIKRIIKPQVNYKGNMIQAAEVVVAFND